MILNKHTCCRINWGRQIHVYTFRTVNIVTIIPINRFQGKIHEWTEKNVYWSLLLYLYLNLIVLLISQWQVFSGLKQLKMIHCGIYNTFEVRFWHKIAILAVSASTRLTVTFLCSFSLDFPALTSRVLKILNMFFVSFDYLCFFLE